MRILSQTGMIDLPYESIGISINHNDNTEIVAYPAGNYNREFGKWIIAKYSTAEKAQKAMEMLREAYMAHNQYCSMAMEQRAIFVMSTSEEEQENLYGVFRFPADDEIEV